jgi:hypothetical protein
MQFKDAKSVEEVIWDMKTAEESRSAQRLLINELANGWPPYTDQEARDNKITVNVNFLEHNGKLHDADRQFQNGFKTTANFFTVDCDYGPAHKRRDRSAFITSRLNFYIKRSLEYSEMLDGVFANLVLHGPGPSAWIDNESWCPDDLCIGDILVPSNTKRSLRNLEHFAIFRKYTAWELWRLTHGPAVDKAWNMPLVEKCLKWANNNNNAGTVSDTTYTPEKLSEQIRANGGQFVKDSAPTIDVWDVYFLNDENKEFGWNRRIVLDSGQNNGNKMGFNDNEFLYDPGTRKYANGRSEILHVQFGDASRVAPFLWHSVRSLGWLLYSVCHLQNRLRCRFNEHVFESMMQYFACADSDQEMVKKLDLTNFGAIPNNLRFIPRAERWSIDQRVIEMAMMLNRQSMADSSDSYTQATPFDDQKVEKTRAQFVGEMQSVNSMVAAMLNRAYIYEGTRHREIGRRFCIEQSRDPDVRAFRLDCLKEGIPAEALDVNRWNIQPEKTIGMGNQQLAIQQVQMLMSQFQRHDPEAQRDILHDFDLVATGDAARAANLVPLKPDKMTETVHDAQASVGSLMLGVQMHPVKGTNHIETVETLLASLAGMIANIEQAGGNPKGTAVQGMATRAEVLGFQNMARYIGDHVQIIAQDPEEKARVAQYGKDLGVLMNTVKAYGQRLQEQQQAQAPGGGAQSDPAQEAAGKAQALKVMTDAKVQSQDMLAAGKEARTHKKWEADQARKQEAHQVDIANRLAQPNIEAATADIRTAAEIRRDDAKAKAAPEKPTKKDTE